MIEIIKEGNLEKKIASCTECGCEFSFDIIDIDKKIYGRIPDTHFEFGILYVKCPCCHTEVTQWSDYKQKK